MKKVGLFLFVAAMAMLLGAMPAFAGKKALSEDDLDLVTAAGQPAVLIAATITYATGSGGSVTGTFSGAGLVSLSNGQDWTLTLNSNTQSTLRALVLNNVVGENQVANGLNIQAAPLSGTASQDNTINQSWGSTLDVGGSGGSGATITISGKCVACVNNAGTAGGNGTISIDGKAVATVNNAGGSNGSRRSIYADEILIGSSIFKQDFNQFVMTLDNSAQNTLAALLVNNVIGLNLVANGVNIASGSIRLADDGGILTGAIGNGGGLGGPMQGLAQSNSVKQYRGTPIGTNATR